MSVYTQVNRPIAVTTPLGEDVLLLESFTGTEEISRPFHFVLDMLFQRNHPLHLRERLSQAQAGGTQGSGQSSTESGVGFDGGGGGRDGSGNPLDERRRSGEVMEFESLLGQSVTVTVRQADGTRRYINGVISRLSEGSEVPAPSTGNRFVRYRAELVPKFWMLTKSVQNRIFSGQTVPQILKTVFDKAGMTNVTFNLREDYQTRDYCVQYGESDFQFASRLMEDEGIFYFFVHDETGHKMMVVDSTAIMPDLPPSVPGQNNLRFEDVEGGVRPDDRIYEWEKTQHVRAGKWSLRDYSFGLPENSLECSQATLATLRVGRIDHRLMIPGNDGLVSYDYPGRFAHRFDGISSAGAEQDDQFEKIFPDGERTVKLRAQEEAVTAVKVSASSTCRQLVAGHQFTLHRHFSGDGPYMLTRVEHSARVEIVTSGDASATNLDYFNRFECIPLATELQFRPARITPKALVRGPQTAVVIGPDGEEIWCDKYGRVRVRFFWDRSNATDAGSENGDPNAATPEEPTTSCWLRVSQPSAGKGWGMCCIPRVGHEVVIGFLEGDPDRPFIQGGVYNAVQMPPVTLPDNRTQTSFSSHSKNGDPENFSGLAFEDKNGSEVLHVHSEKDMIQSSENDQLIQVGGHSRASYTGAQTEFIGGLPLLPIPWVFMQLLGAIGLGAGDAAGSGQGGGPIVSGSPGAPNYLSIEPWFSSKNTALGLKMQLTIGEDFKDVLGWSGKTVIGWENKTVLNPFGYLARWGGSTENKGGIGQGPFFTEEKSGMVSQTVGVINGDFKFVCGAETTLRYGPKVQTSFGPYIELKSPYSMEDSPPNRQAKVEVQVKPIGTAIDGIAGGTKQIGMNTRSKCMAFGLVTFKVAIEGVQVVCNAFQQLNVGLMTCAAIGGQLVCHLFAGYVTAYEMKRVFYRDEAEASEKAKREAAEKKRQDAEDKRVQAEQQRQAKIRRKELADQQKLENQRKKEEAALLKKEKQRLAKQKQKNVDNPYQEVDKQSSEVDALFMPFQNGYGSGAGGSSLTDDELSEDMDCYSDAYQSSYALDVEQHIQILSGTLDGEDSPDGSFILIDSCGTSNADPNGRVIVTANKSVALDGAGLSSVSLFVADDKTGQICISAGEGGGIAIVQGDDVVRGISLNPTNIAVDGGGAPIVLQGDDACIVTIDPATKTITLKADNIKLTGGKTLELSVGSNSLKMDAKSVTVAGSQIAVNADLKLDLAASNLTTSGKVSTMMS